MQNSFHGLLPGRHAGGYIWSGCNPFPEVNAFPSALQCTLYMLTSSDSASILQSSVSASIHALYVSSMRKCATNFPLCFNNTILQKYSWQCKIENSRSLHLNTNSFYNFFSLFSCDHTHLKKNVSPHWTECELDISQRGGLGSANLLTLTLYSGLKRPNMLKPM